MFLISDPTKPSILDSGRVMLDRIHIARYYRNMSEKRKPMTVAEAGRRGGKARAKEHSAEELSKWGSMGGWPKGRPRKTAKKKAR